MIEIVSFFQGVAVGAVFVLLLNIFRKQIIKYMNDGNSVKETK